MGKGKKERKKSNKFHVTYNLEIRINKLDTS
jgi:hypothetical protein